MSNLASSNGDDYPAAAAKHLEDARTLLDAQRHDGAAYLAGYVVECSLRSVVMIGRLAKEAEATAIELGRKGQKVNLRRELQPTGSTLRRFRGEARREARERGRDHDLGDLAEATTGYTAVLAPYVARYAPTINPKNPPFGWQAKFTDIRYHAEGAVKDATAWVKEAEAVYVSTVGAMMRDGLVTS
ncbi:hypothetical protein [Polyangium spumosum]|uniref:HEPN domain-containing protein n=1 Tax=Polyangium spumosum TaxID=889282 RepID=A0A6N7PUH6_9BACT|nr:hypothetical protein [Polyangium spumosum]MRG94456.1 hypothetical protein [Polyangium spumosum]